MAGRETRPVAARLVGETSPLWKRAKFIVKTSAGVWWRGDGVPAANLLFWSCCAHKALPQNTPSVSARKPIARLRARNSIDQTLPQPFLHRRLRCRVLNTVSERAVLPTRLLLRLCALHSTRACAPEDSCLIQSFRGPQRSTAASSARTSARRYS